MQAALKLETPVKKKESSLAVHFAGDSYKIHQPLIQITAESYTITSEDKSEMFKAIRPRQLTRTFFAKIGCAFSFIIIYVVSVAVLGMTLKASLGEAGLAAAALLGFAFSFLGTLLIAKLLYPKRRATLKKGDEKGPVVFTIRPTSGLFLFNHEYGVYDANDQIQAIFKKRFLENLILKKWHCYHPDNQYRFTAKEDSILIAFMRRYMFMGRFIPLHFDFTKGAKVFGQYKRKFSVRDKYSLDFNSKAMPPWLAVATAILLDTGESR